MQGFPLSAPARRGLKGGVPIELIVLLLIFFVFAVLYAWTLPYFMSPDERYHFEFVKRLMLEGQLPIASEAGYSAAEEHQPPTWPSAGSLTAVHGPAPASLEGHSIELGRETVTASCQMQ